MTSPYKRIRKLRRESLALTLVLWTMLAASFASTSVDSHQAEAMLALLQHCGTNSVSAEEIADVIALPGTRLIIAQQNVSRRVTPAQYETILVSACRGSVAAITPSEPGARGERGVEGLTRDVAPSIIWARERVPELRKKLQDALSIPNLDNIVPLALANLPEQVNLSPKMYFVMGGRAGAAASDDGIYIDLLAGAWRSREKSTPKTSQEIVEFFAHETHHVGYGMILDRKKEGLHLSVAENQAWRLLQALLMEGSATLLINAHGNWTELESAEHIQSDLRRLPQLLPESQIILQRSIEGSMDSQQYQSSVSDFVGEGYHATGAKLLYVIERVLGKPGVLTVMDNPRTLLTVYNKCAAQVNEPFRFEAKVAKAVENLGTHP
jgi:hypothetical protein